MRVMHTIKQSGPLLLLMMGCVLSRPVAAWNYDDWADNTFNGGKRQAQERAAQQENQNEMSARDACKQAVRRAVPDPSTLQFDTRMPGLYNPNGVSKTEGGYAVAISGRTADGMFSVKCYTDLSFRVTRLTE